MVKRFALAFLQTLRKDLAWFNSFGAAGKILALTLGLILIFIAWCLGLEWWTTVVSFRPNYIERQAPRYEIASVFLAAIVLTYIFGVIERARRDLR
jgi:hypothetical protein